MARKATGRTAARTAVAKTDRRPRVPWRGSRPSGRDSARTRLVEAAASCLLELGWERTSLAAVAERAGVSRPTLYAYFGGREELLSEGLALASSWIVGEVVEEASHARSAPQFVVGATVAAARVLRLHRDLFAAAATARASASGAVWTASSALNGPGALSLSENRPQHPKPGTAQAATSVPSTWVPPMLGPEAISLAVGFLEPLKRFVPSLADDPEELEEIAETALRFLVSVLEMETPRTRGEKRLAAYLMRRMVPALGIEPTSGPT